MAPNGEYRLSKSRGGVLCTAARLRYPTPMSLIGFDLFKALAIGLLVGLTELLPVSTSGHLLLAERLANLDAQVLGAAFLPLTELGVLLALIAVYFLRLVRPPAG